MASPQGRLSTELVLGTYLAPEGRDFNPFVDYERGPIAIEDTTEGLLYQDWTFTYDPVSSEITALAETTGGSTVVATVEHLKSLSCTFDQAGRFYMAYTTNLSSYLYWYDTFLGQTVTTDLGPDVISPSVNLDDKRETQNTVNDVLLWYTKEPVEGEFDLYMLRQRDRFLIEEQLASGLESGYLENIGMTDGLRVQLRLSSVKDIAVPSGALLDIAEEALATGWVDLTLFETKTFEEAFGVPVYGDDFTQVIPVGYSISVNSPADDVRMYVVHSNFDANEVVMLVTDVNGNVNGGVHYLGYPLPEQAYIQLQRSQNKFIVIASDTGNARIRKQDFSIQEEYPYNLYMYSNPLTKYTLDPQLHGKIGLAGDPETVFDLDGDGLQVSTGLPVVFDMDGDGLEVVSGTAIIFIASTFVYPNVANPTVNKPPGTVEGDLMIAQVNSRNSVITAISGFWTPLWQHGIGPTGGFQPRGGSYNEETHCWYRFAGPSEPASYTVSTVNSGNAIGISTYRNVNSIDHVVSPNTNVSPNISGGLIGDWLLSVHGTSYEAVAHPTVPAGMTEDGHVYDSGYDVGTMIAHEELLADGDTGTRTFTGDIWNSYAATGSILLKPPFYPTKIDGNRLWLDPSDKSTMWQDAAGTIPVTADGQILGKWEDKSGYGNHFIADAGLEPTAYPDSGYVQFTNAGDKGRLYCNSFTALTAGEMLIRLKMDSISSSAGFHHIGNDFGLNNHYPYVPGGSIIYDGFGCSARQSLTTSAHDYLVPHTVDISAAANQHVFRINGATLTTKSATTSFSTTARLGWSLGSVMDGKMYGVVLYDHLLSTGDRALVMAYMDSLPDGSFFDSFTDTNGTLLTAHTPDKSSWGGWSFEEGSTSIEANEVKGTTAASNSTVVTTGISDVYIEMDLTVELNAGVILRMTDSNNYWVFWAGNAGLHKMEGGVQTLEAFGSAPSLPCKIKVRAIGDTFTCQVNDDPEVVFVHSFNQTAVKHGIRGTLTNFRVDNFSIDEAK